MRVECLNCSRMRSGGKVKQHRCYNAECPAYKAEQVLKQMAAGRMQHGTN